MLDEPLQAGDWCRWWGHGQAQEAAGLEHGSLCRVADPQLSVSPLVATVHPWDGERVGKAVPVYRGYLLPLGASLPDPLMEVLHGTVAAAQVTAAATPAPDKMPDAPAETRPDPDKPRPDRPESRTERLQRVQAQQLALEIRLLAAVRRRAEADGRQPSFAGLPVYPSEALVREYERDAGIAS